MMNSKNKEFLVVWIYWRADNSTRLA